MSYWHCKHIPVSTSGGGTANNGPKVHRTTHNLITVTLWEPRILLLNNGTYPTPGRSWVRPPLTITTLCSCKLCPSPWMYAMTVLPLESFTRATFRLAELGFLGDWTNICVQTPLRWGEPPSRGDFCLIAFCGFLRRMAWFIVTHADGDGWKARKLQRRLAVILVLALAR